MNTCVALLRGINVGGNNILPMQELRKILGSLGCEDVSTYIQSGNAVFRSAMQSNVLQGALTVAIDQAFGFAPRVQIYTLPEFTAILDANPFPAAIDDPKSLYISFLAAPATNVDHAALEALRSATERCVLTASAFYLHAPDGIGRSKLAARIERYLGVATTSRNWRTASKLAELAAATIA